MYFDYSSYFQTLVTNTNTIIKNQEDILCILSVIIISIIIYFIYIYIRNMIKGG